MKQNEIDLLKEVLFEVFAAGFEAAIQKRTLAEAYEAFFRNFVKRVTHEEKNFSPATPDVDISGFQDFLDGLR